MNYQGGKFHLRKKLCGHINRLLCGRPYLEPFMGGGNVTVGVEAAVRVVSDANPELIAMWKALLNGWVPPENVSEETYKEAREGKLEPHVTAFIATQCSWGAKWWGGYARNSRGINYFMVGSRKAVKEALSLGGISLSCCNYWEHNPEGMLVYCDPPYVVKTGYNHVGRFDHDRFWFTMGLWAMKNTVLVSFNKVVDGTFLIEEFSTKVSTGIKGNMQTEKLLLVKGLK